MTYTAVLVGNIFSTRHGTQSGQSVDFNNTKNGAYLKGHYPPSSSIYTILYIILSHIQLSILMKQLTVGSDYQEEKIEFQDY